MATDSETGNPLVDEVREVRRQISKEFDHDPAKLIAFLMKYQEQFAHRFAQFPREAENSKPAA